jgi:hypothetical protein
MSRRSIVRCESSISTWFSGRVVTIESSTAARCRPTGVLAPGFGRCGVTCRERRVAPMRFSRLVGLSRDAARVAFEGTSKPQLAEGARGATSAVRWGLRVAHRSRQTPHLPGAGARVRTFRIAGGAGRCCDRVSVDRGSGWPGGPRAFAPKRGRCDPRDAWWSVPSATPPHRSTAEPLGSTMDVLVRSADSLRGRAACVPDPDDRVVDLHSLGSAS